MFLSRHLYHHIIPSLIQPLRATHFYVTIPLFYFIIYLTDILYFLIYSRIYIYTLLWYHTIFLIHSIKLFTDSLSLHLIPLQLGPTSPSSLTPSYLFFSLTRLYILLPCSHIRRHLYIDYSSNLNLILI